MSNIFISWVTTLDKTLGVLLVFWPSREQVISTKPASYRHLMNFINIMDCSEVLLETTKNMDLQFMTWSDYKHHNSLKLLISVAPNSDITYVFPLYCGILDKALTNDYGCLVLVEPYDEIM